MPEKKTRYKTPDNFVADPNAVRDYEEYDPERFLCHAILLGYQPKHLASIVGIHPNAFHDYVNFLHPFKCSFKRFVRILPVYRAVRMQHAFREKVGKLKADCNVDTTDDRILVSMIADRAKKRTIPQAIIDIVKMYDS